MDRFIKIIMYKNSISCANKIVTYIVFQIFPSKSEKNIYYYKFFSNFYVDPVLEKKIRNKNYFFYIVWYEFEKLKYFEFLIL